MDARLSENQKAAVRGLAETVEENVLSARKLPPFREAKRALESKRFDYAGNPIEYMLDLKAELVIPTWPKVGEAGVVNLVDFLEGETRAAVLEPRKWILPVDQQPAKTKKSVGGPCYGC